MNWKNCPFITGQFSVAEHNFYYSLILCSMYKDAGKEDRQKYLTGKDESEADEDMGGELS